MKNGYGRLMSIVLTFLLSISMLISPAVTTMSFADDDPPEDQISFVTAEPVELVENVDGYMDYNEIQDPETGEWKEVSYFRYDWNLERAGNQFIVNGVVYTYDADEYEFINANGEELDYYYFSDNQSYENQWSVANPGTITVEYNDATYEVPVRITENPIKTISYEPAKPIVIIENTNGYQYDNYYCYNEYSLLYRQGDKFTVNNTDVYTYDDDRGEFIDNNGKVLEGELDIDTDQSEDNPWTPANPGTITVKYAGRTCEVLVTIEENPVRKIKYTPAEPVRLVENVDGFWDWDYVYNDKIEDDEKVDYFIYEHSLPQHGDELLVNDTDVYTFDYSRDGFYDKNGKKAEFEVSFDTDQSATNQWTLAKAGNIIVNYMGSTDKVPATVVENPVGEIKYEFSAPLELLEGVDGYWTTDEVWNEKEQKYEDVRYFCYYTPGYDRGDVLYIDGVPYDYYPGGVNGVFYNEEKDDIREMTYNRFSIESDQSPDNQWSVSNPGHITVTYMNKTYKATVTILKDKDSVDSISYKCKEPLTVYEGVDGFFEDEEEEWFYYDDPMHYREGDILTVDGTDYTYRCAEDSENGKYKGDYYFINAKGDWIDSGELSYRTDQSRANKWTQTNPGNIILSYKDKTTDVPVTVIPNPVGSISYKQSNVIKINEYTNGWYFDADDGYNYDFPGVQAGDQLTVNYKDARGAVTYTASLDAEEEEMVFTDAAGNLLDDDYFRVQRVGQAWTAGEHEFNIIYFGNTATYKVEIVPTTVTSISFKPVKTTEAYRGFGSVEYDEKGEEYLDYYYTVTYNEGDELTVSHKDGTNTVYTYGWVDEGRYRYRAFCDPAGNELEEYPDIYSDQYDKHWVEGQNNELTMVLYNCKTTIPVVIKENPVKSVKTQLRHKAYADMRSIYFNRDKTGKLYRYFSISRYRVLEDGDSLEILFKDGSKKTVTWDGRWDEFYDQDGDYVSDAYITTESDQEDVHWTRGGDNPLYFTYMGVRSDPVQMLIGSVHAISVGDADIKVTSSTVYTGKEIEPELQVKVGSNILQEGTDYTVTYYNNVDAGLAVANVTGIGKYNGRQRFQYAIYPAEAKPVIELDRTILPYTGEEQRPDAVVKVNGKAVGAKLIWPEKSSEVGKYTVTAELNGNYTGTATATYEIMDTDLSKATVTAVDATYSGKKLEPKVTVTFAGQTLVKDTDYTVEYSNNVKAGTGTAKVTGKGIYRGTNSAKFKINKAKNKLKVKAKKSTFKAKANKATTLKAKDVFKVTNNTGKGKVTYKKTKGDNKIVVSKTGKVTVKKGLKVGKTYTVKVKATSVATANYKSATTTVSLKIKITK